MAKKTLDEVEIPTNPNLPPWLISPKEEKAIFERWKKKAYAQCDAAAAAYVECSNSTSNPIKAMKICADVHRDFVDCVAKFQNQKCLDIERELWIEEKMEKRRQMRLQQSDQSPK